MTLWYHTYPRDSADGASHARGSSKPARDARRSNERWPPLRASVVISLANLILWAAIGVGFWLVL